MRSTVVRFALAHGLGSLGRHAPTPPSARTTTSRGEPQPSGGSWLGQNGSKGPDFFALTAGFRLHLMDDEESRAFFVGSDCALCNDARVTVERNALVAP